MIKVLKAKATLEVVKSSLDYEGSITLPKELCDKLGIRKHEHVDVNNKTNGNRFQTYVIFGDSVQVNGAAAHLCENGDIIHVNCFAYIDESKEIKPVVIDRTK